MHALFLFLAAVAAACPDIDPVPVDPATWGGLKAQHR